MVMVVIQYVALLNAQTLTWTATGFNKADSINEAGWTLLPSGEVLTVAPTEILRAV